MKIKFRNFPHPVLHPTKDDILKSHFTGELISQVIKGPLLEFDVRFKVKNETLNSLIENESAHLNVHFECSSTMQRLSFQIKANECTQSQAKNETIYEAKIEVDSALLNKKVDINYFILANEDISQYNNKNMHPDFSGLSFSIKKGDILAVAITQTLHLEKEPIVNTSSIFNIVKDNAVSPFTIGMNNNQIDVFFPEEIHGKIKSYNELYGDRTNNILIQMVCYPTLLHVLYVLQSLNDDETEEYESLDWFITLEKKLISLNKSVNELNINEIPSLAYTVLNDDTQTPWLDLENILEDNGGDDSDDEQ